MAGHPSEFAAKWVSEAGVLGSLALICASATPALAQDTAGADQPQRVEFASEVYPILQQRCHACHGELQQMGEFRLDSKAAALAGGVSGKDIVPGNADASALYQRIAGIGELNPMPMTGDRLSEDEVALVKRWIDQGAGWPDGVGVEVQTVSRHWAYLPAVRPNPPSVRRNDQESSPIDSFILARLGEEGLSLNPEAPKEALARRVSLDLTGLPPSVEEVDRFRRDTRPDAYERLVDRTLKSPHFGEHWARHWLDLARYADTNGYESDEPRTIWAYRDWVIDAFNRNLPFDQFTIEQLAGDLLPDPTVDQLVATGFHRNTMVTNEAGSKDDEFYDAAVKDRIDTTATVWLGSTLGCAQCHDHKYDPFRQSEYYQLYSIFNNTADSAIKISEELEVFKGDSGELRRREAEVKAAKQVLDTATDELAASQRTWEAQTLPRIDLWREAWNVLRPRSATGVDGKALEALPDGSVVADEPGDGPHVYDLAFDLGPTALTGLRLEAMRDSGLPGSGLGWGKDGTFSLAGIEVEAWTPEQQAEQAELLPSQPKWSSWHVIGPFRVRSREEAFRTSFPPEVHVDLAAVYEQGHLAWTARKDWVDGRVHYLQYLPDSGDSNCASYAFRTVDVHEDTTVQVSLGSLKGLRVWVNGKELLSTDPTRSTAPDQEEVQFDLRAGTNEVLLKLTNDTGRYGFYFRPYFGQEKQARLRVARATGDEGGWNALDLAALLDAKGETGWSPPPEATGRAGEPSATLRFARPVELPAGSQLKVRVIHGAGKDPKGVLGRFRVLATSMSQENLDALLQTPATVQEVLQSPSGERSNADRDRLAAFYRSIAPKLENERNRHAALKASLHEFRSKHTTKTLVMRELPEPRPGHIQRRGSFLDLGERVEPGVPFVLAAGQRPSVPDRLALARWLTSGENPLTARVRVNQIWSRIFRQGLVTTPEDFGSQGDRPSHPELLDWLATEFVRLGWDTQALLRTMLTSAAYRQDSSTTPEKLEKDPRNILLSRGARYRVGAEAVRDIALAASGQLSRKVGGPSVFPPQPPEVFGEHFIEGGFKLWPTSEGEDRYRRGLYTFYKRTIVYPTFMNFDGPDRTVCTVNRSLSNTPLQALNTLNDPSFVEAAGALAARMLDKEGGSSAERIARGFQSVLAREPEPDELARLEAFLDRMAARYSEAPAEAANLVARAVPDTRSGQPGARFAPWVMVANVLLNLDETFTRE
ncbi:MAG: PSD1 and planctomycete cytochrome C domain-containing protein [Bryobacterales bacterium]|nr:PSD1 and planctomycete cytochrome C domain-containing protein [Bryobacterales bacterium]